MILQSRQSISTNRACQYLYDLLRGSTFRIFGIDSKSKQCDKPKSKSKTKTSKNINKTPIVVLFS